MRLTSVKVILVGMLCIMSIIHVQGNNDGLYFNSHSYPTNQRTTLLLNDGNPIELSNVFRMSFDMDLRSGEPLFGNIFCIKTDDDKHIDAILAAPTESLYRPVLSMDGKLHYIDCDVTARKNIKVGIVLDRKANKIVYNFGGHKINIQADIKHSTTATVMFGMHLNDGNYVDVAPMNVRDIRISHGEKEVYTWNLRQHNKNICMDNISDAQATANNGHWILDDHVEWKTVFSYKSSEKVQVTFNPKDNVFYIVDSKTVRCFDPTTKTTKIINVKGGHRAMMYSNYIAYSKTGPGLYTYNIKDRLISSFDFTTARWSNDRFIADEPGGFNHSMAEANDTVIYLFGGYGFYKYKNCLWRINTKSGEMRQIDYSPKINPRMGAATAIVGDKLYIFGGYGNATGEQELPCTYYYDLTCIDLKTMKAETLWTADDDHKTTSFILASEMLYNSKDNSFYAATTNNSGRLIKLSMKEPGWKIVTGEMSNDLDYKDMTFDLYRSDKEGKIYVIINRRMNNLEHNVQIFSIDLPVQDDYMITNKKEPQSKSAWWWLLFIIIPIGIFTAYCIKRSKKHKAQIANNDTYAQQDTEKTTIEEQTTEIIQTDENNIEEIEEKEDKHDDDIKYYNPTGGYISLLGKFVVHDSNGEDITSQFTRRTRNLLFMLLLHSERSSKGIEIHLLDEALWQEMNEEAARNNRNVYMRKLRVLLEKIGKIEVINDKIHYRIELGEDVFFDYHEALTMISHMEENDDDEEITARTLELLFEGPLLPNYSFEWLDKFKADYSNAAISLLTRQLRHELQNANDVKALKIAETIMMHDPFSDNALATQCSILCRRHKKGIAKNVYDNFCKNYEASIGEKYQLSFAEVCK